MRVLTGGLLSSVLIAMAPGWVSAHVRPATSPAPVSTGTVSYNDVAATSPSNAWIVGDRRVGRNPFAR